MKKNVTEKLFKNMKKYMPKSMLKQYQIHPVAISAGVIEFVKEYYNKNLPVTVEAWRQVNHFEIYDECIDHQIEFIVKNLCYIFIKNERLRNERVTIIGTHIAMNEAIFPVFHLNLNEYNLEIVTSFNGFEWIASFKSKSELDFDYMNLINPSKKVTCDNSHIPKEMIYASIKESNKEFTTQFESKYDFYTFCVLIKNILNC